MKTSLLLLTLLAAIALCDGQTTNLSISAESIERQGSAILYRGKVEMATDALVLHVDEAQYHPDSGEVESRGNVRVKLRATIQATCEGTGCISAESPKSPALAKIGDAMARMLAARQTQAAK